jgi:hypothetical protein
MKFNHRICLMSALFLMMTISVSSFAKSWTPAIVIDIEGDTLKGEIKAGKRSFSDFLKFRSPDGKKIILTPEFFPEVITGDTYFRSIWFDEEIIGYNTYQYGKLLTSGCIEVYDVVYPYRTCACKTQGTRQNHWVIKIESQSLFILYHNMFSDEIYNLMELQRLLKPYQELYRLVLTDIHYRNELLLAIERYNEQCREINTTFKTGQTINNLP